MAGDLILAGLFQGYYWVGLQPWDDSVEGLAAVLDCARVCRAGDDRRAIVFRVEPVLDVRIAKRSPSLPIQTHTTLSSFTSATQSGWPPDFSIMTSPGFKSIISSLQYMIPVPPEPTVMTG